MKRIVSLILIALSIFSVGAIDTQAYTTNIIWIEGELDTPDGTKGFWIAQIQSPIDATGFEVFIPESEHHVFSIGGFDSYIQFRDTDNNIIFENDIKDFRGTLSGVYNIDYLNLGLENVGTINIWIMQNYNVLTFNTNDYKTYLQDNDSLMWVYNFQQQILWNNVYDSVTEDPYITTTLNLIQDAKIFSLFIPESRYHLKSNDATDESFKFYNAVGTLLATHTISEFNFGQISGLIKIDLEVDIGLLIGQASYVVVTIPQIYDDTYMEIKRIPPFYMEYLTNETTLSFNDNLYKANYFINGLLYESVIFVNIPEQIPNPSIPGETFDGWFLANGNEYLFTPITQSMLFNNELNLYGQFSNRSTIDTDLGDPEPSEFFGTLFNTIGMNSTTGYAIMYLIVIILSLVGLRSLNVPNIMMMITMILITAIFMFMGFLPVLMGIVAFGVFALILFSSGGGV